MPRIYLPSADIQGNTVSVTGQKARYLTSVLRCRPGDELMLFDGQGNCFRTAITKADKKEVVAAVFERSSCSLESSLGIILVQGLLKGEKMDIIIQKATELGVREIVPVATGRSQVREATKVERWRKIAEEASRQSGRSIVPDVREASDLGEYLASLGEGSPPGFFFYEGEGLRLSEAAGLLRASKSGSSPGRHTSPPASGLRKEEVIIAIGPEGGFTKEEISLAERKGFIIASLGKRILRAETAAIAAVALTQFLLGDMDGADSAYICQ